MGIAIFFFLLGSLSGLSIFKLVTTKTDIVVNKDDLVVQGSTEIYDDQGELVSLIGQESRINVSYASLPQCVIDAFVAAEDSRFFDHPGFDLPRFTSALITNIRTLSFSEGGSTLTMQVLKNIYFDNNFEKSVSRKIQEIVGSLKISGEVSKERLFELYINKINFGGSCRGIQLAADYYFGKDATDLTIVEAAVLAGIINAPNEYNPFASLENCVERTGYVLYQMYNHGYITETEYKLAKRVDIANLLHNNNDENYAEGETISNKAYIDIVINECIDEYGIDPYTTPVRIYTGLNQTVQETCDSLGRGEIIEFINDYINTSCAVIQNYTGLVVGVCGGRNYNGSRLFNYASDARINPGSTSKAILTYPMGFEHTPLSTSFYFEDEPTQWMYSTITVWNSDRIYHGDVSIQRAFSMSYNIPAIKTYQMVVQYAGNETVTQYMKSIGLDDWVAESACDQYAIGGQNFCVSPIQLAAAESVILSKGLYTTPHTIKSIEFINGTREPIECKFTSQRVLSEGAAWLVSYLENLNVNGGATMDDFQSYDRMTRLHRKDYTVYVKTGTHQYDEYFTKTYNLPDGCSQSFLMTGGTNDYSFSFWMGFDTGKHMDSSCWCPNWLVTGKYDSNASNQIITSIEKAFGKPTNTNNKPSSVTTITHMKAYYPYVSLPSYPNSGKTVTGYIQSKYAHLSEYTDDQYIEPLNAFEASYDENTNNLLVKWATYPDPDMLKVQPTTKLIEVYEDENDEEPKYKFTGARAYDPTWIMGTVEYYCSITNTATGEITVFTPSKNDECYYQLSNPTDQDIEYIVSGWYEYTNAHTQSNVLTELNTFVVRAHTNAVLPRINPSDLSIHNPSTSTSEDGYIMGVDSTMEYSIDFGSTYIPCDSNGLLNLTVGEYWIRYRERDGYLASEPIKIILYATAEDEGGEGGD